MYNNVYIYKILKAMNNILKLWANFDLELIVRCPKQLFPVIYNPLFSKNHKRPKFRSKITKEII